MVGLDNIYNFLHSDMFRALYSFILNMFCLFSSLLLKELKCIKVSTSLKICIEYGKLGKMGLKLKEIWRRAVRHTIMSPKYSAYNLLLEFRDSVNKSKHCDIIFWIRVACLGIKWQICLKK